MLYLTDATCPELSGFESLLDLFGVKIDHTLVVEGDESQYYRSPAYLVPTIETHGVTAGLTENQQVAVAALCDFPDPARGGEEHHRGKGHPDHLQEVLRQGEPRFHRGR